LSQPDRIQLSWGQICWAISMLAAIGGFWVRTEVNSARIEGKLDTLRTTVDERKQYDDFKHGSYEHRLDRLEARRR